MIKIPARFWTKNIQNTKYDCHETWLEDVEYFLKDTIHKSAQMNLVDRLYFVSFKHPKYETLFRIKYSEDKRDDTSQ